MRTERARLNAATLAAIVFIVFALGYRFYSRFLATRIFALDPEEAVPSREFEDGVDYVPTRLHVLWGHHFASIAGAAPVRDTPSLFNALFVCLLLDGLGASVD